MKDKMGSYMIWRLQFKDSKAKEKFEDIHDVRLIHSHFDECEPNWNHGDFIYDVGYMGYAEAEEIVDDLKKIGVVSFKQLCLCDTEDFKEVISSK